jgi:hypothetical protein
MLQGTAAGLPLLLLLLSIKIHGCARWCRRLLSRWSQASQAIHQTRMRRRLHLS